ncbi:MAG: hypothetical protein QOH66_2509 [Actinomycetota bacterium]|nr:hypothetical protein [Actinomycetota bacterium]
MRPGGFSPQRPYRSPLNGASSIDVHIDRIVIDSPSLGPGQADALRDSVEEALALLFGPGQPGRMLAASDVPPSGPPFPSAGYPPNASQLGRDIAGGIHAQLAGGQ